MRLYLIVLFLAVLKSNEAKLTTSKASKSKPPQNAIIAIQIIDPNENTTSAKNSKRTIESSLGYGYQGRPKYETYKYSQHDIPPYNPNQYTAQAASYHTPSVASKPVQNAEVSNFYQPGTILFSTINQQGQLGELSSQFPESVENYQYPIPVIILRVHPDQLANPLYPKLPQNHLHAAAINSININSLLSNYIGSNVKQQPVVQEQPTVQQQPIVYQQPHQEEYQNSQAYVQPQAEAAQYQSNDYQGQDYQSQDYQSQAYQSQQYYPQYQYEETQDVSQNQEYQAPQHVQALPEPRIPDYGANYQYSSYQVPSPVYQQPSAPVKNYKSELLTDENYPSDKHTQVIFKRSKGKSSTRNRLADRSAPQVHSTKPRVSSHESQPQEDQNAKYYQHNTKYYTIRYTDDQGYTRHKTPSYGVKEQVEDDKPVQSKNYLYISSNPTYNPHV
ncbi:uncharacterized protein LOC108911229 [Anoplophora glabripennis]|uniref:uncharacterized protein LOC108911229 n=1 Tax=Anoplophora glabripennis TaxID=217634 RepID=UPI0008746C54|nr:uncharacterized protein LOC108911229 [Anoplophora glabripennis]